MWTTSSGRRIFHIVMLIEDSRPQVGGHFYALANWLQRVVESLLARGNFSPFRRALTAYRAGRIREQS
jgi:hypothetical protein